MRATQLKSAPTSPGRPAFAGRDNSGSIDCPTAAPPPAAFRFSEHPVPAELTGLQTSSVCELSLPQGNCAWLIRADTGVSHEWKFLSQTALCLYQTTRTGARRRRQILAGDGAYVAWARLLFRFVFGPICAGRAGKNGGVANRHASEIIPASSPSPVSRSLRHRRHAGRS